jgi:hypothetical protein
MNQTITTYKSEDGEVEVWSSTNSGDMIITAKTNGEKQQKIYLRNREIIFLTSILYENGFFDKYKRCVHDE